jgi:HSF-type DNA-binding
MHQRVLDLLTASNWCGSLFGLGRWKELQPSTSAIDAMSGARKRKHRGARPQAWDVPCSQPVALHQPFCSEDPPQTTHSGAEKIRSRCEGSLSHNKHQNLTCPSYPQRMQRSHKASLVELLHMHTPSTDVPCRDVPLTRHSGVQRVVRIPIDRPDQGNAAYECDLKMRAVDARRESVTFNKTHRTTKQKKSASFPEKLYAILEEPDLVDVIAWTPHGTSWRVLQTFYLQEFVLPRYFRSERYTSFMRQVRSNPLNFVVY